MKMKTVYPLFIFLLIFSSIGCEAFTRKFTRKPKKKDQAAIEVVLEPEVYTEFDMTQEELYRRYFTFWKSWQVELTVSLEEGRSKKKKMDCAEEAIKNLINLRALLDEEKKMQLDGYINQIKKLSDKISQDSYGADNAANAKVSERIKREILREFSYNKVKDRLV
ncbi:MAG: hypothetical protein ABIH19_01470 [Candidatus Omnitrophota bacterium]